MRTLQGVLEAVRTVRAELDEIEQFLQNLNAMFAAQVELTPSSQPERQWSRPPRQTSFGQVIPAAPDGWKDRMTFILRESPDLRPTEIKDRYTRLKWPGYDKENLPNQIRSTLFFMKRDGLVKVDSEGKYSLNEAATS
jgi:hypothetical protein